MKIWPFSVIAERREWRARDRQEITIATAAFTTNIVDGDGKRTGVKQTHVVVFYADGNGVRYSRVTSSGSESTWRAHHGLVQARAMWRHHADLPTWARRVVQKGVANLYLIQNSREAK